MKRSLWLANLPSEKKQVLDQVMHLLGTAALGADGLSQGGFSVQLRQNALLPQADLLKIAKLVYGFHLTSTLMNCYWGACEEIAQLEKQASQRDGGNRAARGVQTSFPAYLPTELHVDFAALTQATVLNLDGPTCLIHTRGPGRFGFSISVPEVLSSELLHWDKAIRSYNVSWHVILEAGKLDVMVAV